MTREELLVILNEVLPDMLQPSIDVLLNDVKTFMGETVTPLADKIESLGVSQNAAQQDTSTDDTVDTATSTPENITEDETQEMPNDTLQARLKLLEQKLADAEAKEAKQAKEAQDMRFNSTLSSELDKLSPLHKSIVQELLATRLRADATEESGSWLTKDGKTIKEAIETFFATPEGMHFLPSKHINGADVQEPTAPKTGDNLDLDSQLAAAFL